MMVAEVTRTSHDAGNRPTRVDYLKDNTAESFGYDPAGNLNAAANQAVGYAFGWDRLNRLVAKLDSRAGVGANKSLSFSYDKVGNMLTKTTYQGSTTRYVYNAANRLVMLQNPDYTQVNYQFDPAGRLLSRVTANGARSSHQYDANGWLTQLSHYDAANALVSQTNYTRDRVGHITGQSDAAGATAYTLDALYRLTRAVYPGSTNVAAAANGASASASSVWSDAHGTFAAGGAIDGNRFQYFNPACWPNAVAGCGTQAGPSWISQPNVLPQWLQINFAGTRTIDSVNVFALQDDYGAPQEPTPDMTNIYYGLAAFTVQYWTGSAWADVPGGNVTGNRQVWRELRFAPLSTSRLRVVVHAAGTSDTTARIIEVQAYDSRTGGSEAFTYDAVGNRLTRTLGSVVQNANTRFYSYTPGTNRLAQTRKGSSTGTVDSSFTYDHEGRLITQTGAGAKTLSWDAKGRVKSVGAESYTYDPMDHRIGRSGGNLGNRSYYLEGEHLESEYSGNTLLAKYFRGSSTDELVAAWLLDTAGNTKPYLFHHDQVNSVTAETGHNGGTTKSSRYQAFGQGLLTTGGSPSNLKYTGREFDQNGLYYYRARYYDPALGRFISEDPMGFAAGDVNFYAYVGNNPINANDPSGKVDVILTIGKQQLDVRNQGTPGTNYLVRGSANGTTYPMGAGPFGQDPSKFTQLIEPTQTSALVDWGRSHIQNNRLNGATGDAGLTELTRQSGTGAPWDTKQFLPSTSLYVINGKAELNDYVGNAIWGTGVNSLGTSELVARAGAQGQSLWANGAFDDPRDQEAIHFGFTLPTTSSFGPGASNGWGGGAAGGFLLYPNKSNTNQMQSVYSK